MESLLARLLESFERGRMSRRQLIQSLALAATAGPALALTRPASVSAAPGADGVEPDSADGQHSGHAARIVPGPGRSRGTTDPPTGSSAPCTARGR